MQLVAAFAYNPALSLDILPRPVSVIDASDLGAVSVGQVEQQVEQQFELREF
ncbi:MAG: hypothetical protein K1X79_02750 [Oligoflexia bacterium]|nr:hypothetical protein [Oligoflexia bacterium]